MKKSVSHQLSSGEAVACARALKLASPLVLSTPVLRIATFHSGSLGALIASLAALMALRDSFPGARLDAFARAPLLPLLESFSGVDGALARPGGAISSQAALMARLHGAGYDIALSFSQSSNALLLLWATGAPVRAGLVPSRMDALLTHKIAKNGASGQSAALELVRGVGATPRGQRARDFLRIAPEITARAQNLLDQSGIHSPFLLIAMETRRAPRAQPGAPKGASLNTIRALAARFPLVLVGLKPQTALRREIGDAAHPIVDLGGQTDVLSLAALAEMSRGAFGIGDGALQFAKLFERPITTPLESDAARALQIFGF